MRIAKLLVAAPLMLVTACDMDPLGPNQHLVVSHVVAPIVHQVHIASEGASTPIGWCAPGVARIAITGTGTATVVGRFKEAQTACLNLATGAVTDGVNTVTAANGDNIYLTWSGQATTPTTLELNYIVTGGTGRFVHVQGALNVVVEHPTPTTFVATGSGWLTYSASDRASN